MLICGAPRAGKTYQLVQACLKNNGIFITFSKQEADRLQGLYPDLEVITYSSWQSDKMRGILWHDKKLYVDNADIYLRQTLTRPGTHLAGYTVSDNPRILDIPKDIKPEILKRAYGKWLNDNE